MPKSSKPITLPGNNEHVAGMRIGVVAAEREDHLQIQIGTASSDFLQIESRTDQLVLDPPVSSPPSIPWSARATYTVR